MGGTNGTQGQDKGTPIFAPLKLRTVTVKNRILRSNLAGRSPDDKLDLIEYLKTL